MDKITLGKYAEKITQEAYLRQQGLEFTAENMLNNGIDGRIEYLTTLGRYILTINEDERAGNFLNVVDRDTLEMTTFEY